MNLFKRKTKEEKLQALQKEVNELNEAHKNELSAYHIVNDEPVFIHRFTISDDEVCLECIFSDSPKGYARYIPTWRFGYSLHSTRMRWVTFQDKLGRFGLEIKSKI